MQFLSKNISFKRDFLKILTGNVITQAIAYFSTIIVSRELGPEKYGIFSLLVALFTIAIQLSEFGISTPYVKFASRVRSTFEKNNLFATIAFIRFLIALLLSTIIYYFSKDLSVFILRTPLYQPEIKIVSYSLIITSLFKHVIAHLQALQNFLRYNLLNISSQLLKLFCTVIVALQHFSSNNLYYLFTINIFYILPALLLYAFANVNKFRALTFRFVQVKPIINMAFWVFLSSLAVLVMMQLDMFMLQKLSTTEEVGYYSAANQLAMAFPLITMSITTTLLPKLGDYLAKHTIQQFVLIVLKKSYLPITLLIILLAISSVLITNIYGDNYKPSISVFQILICSFLVGVIVNPISLVFYELDKAYILTWMNWAQLGINYSANLYFIPLYQANGAAFATSVVKIFGGGVVIICVSMLSNKTKKQSFSTK